MMVVDIYPAFVIGLVFMVLFAKPYVSYLWELSHLDTSQGYKIFWGIFMADIVLIAPAFFVVVVLGNVFAISQSILRFGGALYLLWAALCVCAAALKALVMYFKKTDFSQEIWKASPFPISNAFMARFAVKVGWFFLAYLLYFANYSQLISSFIILFLVLQLCSFSYASLIIFSNARVSVLWKQRGVLVYVANALLAIASLWIIFTFLT